MKKRFKFILLLFVILICPIIIIKLNIISIKFLNTDEFQSNMFTVSSVFMGFSVSTLGILLGLYSEKSIQKVAGTGILLKKIDRFTKSLKYMGIAMVIFFLSIIGIINKLDKLVSGSKIYFLTLGITLFLIGLVFYLIGSYDLIQVLKIIYRVDKNKINEKIKDFEQKIL